MTQPAIETPGASVQSRRPTRSHHGSLYQQGARAAHGIDQGLSLLQQFRPTAAQQDGGGQILLQRRLAGVSTIAALVQTGARQVDPDGDPPTVHPHIDTHVRGPGIDIGPFLTPTAKYVDNGVFAALGTKLGIADAVGST